MRATLAVGHDTLTVTVEGSRESVGLGTRIRWARLAQGTLEPVANTSFGLREWGHRFATQELTTKSGRSGVLCATRRIYRRFRRAGISVSLVAA